MGIFDGTLILSDLDGTLLDSDAQISRGNIEAIKYYMKNGGKFSFATGRNITGMKYFMDVLPANAPGVVSNGALIYDFSGQEIVKAFHIGEKGEMVADAVLSRFPDIGIEVLMPDGSHVINENEITKMHIAYTKMPYRIQNRNDIEKPWLHMLLCREPERMQELEVYVKSAFGDILFFQRSAEYFLEVIPKGINKGSGALYISNMLNIKPEGFYTVGDGPNDMELLACTKNAFAPKNACKEVLTLNPQMLPDNDHDPFEALVRIVEGRMKK